MPAPPTRVIVSPRFELFFALATVLEPDAPTPPEEVAARWLAQARRKLDAGFRRRLGLLAPEDWRHLARTLGTSALAGETDAVIEAVAAIEPSAADILRRFDRLAFASFWRIARSGFSGAESPQEGEPGATDAMVYFPSWFVPPGSSIPLVTATGRPIEARFFAPQDGPPASARASSAPVSMVGTDPALVFRALGDATRYAIVSLLARDALTSAELARRLGVATPTLAHHLRALRQARLVTEAKSGTSIRLRLNRGTLEGLSAATIAVLTDPNEPIRLRRSRRAG